jgi:hypothetical protein
MIIEDVRSYIFPLLLAEEVEGKVKWKTNEFLGTAFFITNNGIALTAAHCVPSPVDLGSRKLYAGIWYEGGIQLFYIAAATVFDNIDVAILKVKVPTVKYFPILFEDMILGSDVWTVGIPAHEIREGDKRIVRLLKGNVTFLSRFAELSFPAPKGMSGSPVFIEGKVVGILTGNLRSEQLEDQFEEIIQVSDDKEIIRYGRTSSVVNYALAQEIKPLKDLRHEVFDGASFSEFIDKMNQAKR